nr:immunoglobulin light chain junction region [Macaca mulatta]MPO05715.1 immunoglobulin light chain junction region [Macaca mulatta]MPO06198.1 immunoglobulin light chain junction region [Macaca mulatta]MPO07124.1 immunoglobulin light chain junction region [Macaca mulatta]MPO07783.1 immunoglobulin light chain junction region [Macaca mulatta]
YSSYADSNVLF